MAVQGTEALAPEKILVRGTNWVGDGVMSLPALEALRQRFPSAEIVLVVEALGGGPLSPPSGRQRA